MKRERGFGTGSLWSTLIRPVLRRGAALAVGAALLAMAAAPRAAQADAPAEVLRACVGRVLDGPRTTPISHSHPKT